MSDTTRRVTALLALAALGLAACDYDNPPAPANTTHETITTQADTGVTLAPDTKASVVTRVVDGDTIDVQDVGRVRLIGVDTPERGDCWYAQATDALRALLPVGSSVTLIPDRTPKDRYGRSLYYVENAANEDVGAQQVVNGNAVGKPYPPDTDRSDGYEAFQKLADTGDRGFWANPVIAQAARNGSWAARVKDGEPTGAC